MSSKRTKGRFSALPYIRATDLAVTWVISQHADGREERTAYATRLDAEIHLSLIPEDNRAALAESGLAADPTAKGYETDDRPLPDGRLPDAYVTRARIEPGLYSVN
jgi:hypothetical protein